MVRNEISKLYFEAKTNNNGRLPRGQFKMIHDATIKKYSLVNDFSISPRLIQSRIRRNKLTVLATDSQSPMCPVEPVIKQIVVWKQEAGQPITPAEGLAVANSLIDGTVVQKELKAFQLSKQKPPTGVLSNKYWKLFMRRHKESLQARKGYRVASNCAEWVTYENVAIMYDLCYEQMIEAGIAVRYEETKDRSDLTLRAYLTDRGYTKTGSGFEEIANSLVVAAEESAVEGTVVGAAIEEAPEQAVAELPEANCESLSQILQEETI